MKGPKPNPPLLMIPDPCRETRRKSERGPGRTRTRAGPSAGRVLTAHPDLVVDELAGDLHLLGGAADGEDPGVWVGGGRRVPLQLHMGTRLLVDALDGFTTCRDASLPVHLDQSSCTHEELLVLMGPHKPSQNHHNLPLVLLVLTGGPTEH